MVDYQAPIYSGEWVRVDSFPVPLNGEVGEECHDRSGGESLGTEETIMLEMRRERAASQSEPAEGVLARAVVSTFHAP